MVAANPDWSKNEKSEQSSSLTETQSLTIAKIFSLGTPSRLTDSFCVLYF